MENIIKAINISKVYKIPHLQTKNLKTYLIHFRKSRAFEEFYALKNTNFEIMPGEFIGIIGRNGSGKSTLLKIIAGILVPTSGDNIVKGKISSFLELGVGFNPELSGRENIFLYSSILGLSKKEAVEKFSKVLEFSELERFIDAPLKKYSSGMQVRLAFSVAIQSNDPIFLVDEVLAVGDASFQKKCFSVFDQFKKEGKTIIFVSHDMESINRFCDRVIYLTRGEKILEGKPNEMIKSYMDSLQSN